MQDTKRTSALEITKLEKGNSYSADIHLPGMMERYATNNTVAKELTKLGFTNVVVTGTGVLRKAVGIWAQETRATVEDPRVSNVRKN